MLYIVKTSDLRYYYLAEMCKKEFDVLYDTSIPINKTIDNLFITLDGIDQFGYIKNTTIILEDILKINKVKIVTTGKTNKILLDLSEKYNFTIKTLYNNLKFNFHEFNIKLNVIKFFLENKLQMSIEDVKILVLGSETSYLFDKYFLCDVVYKDSEFDSISWNRYDVVINFSNYDVSNSYDKIVIEMNDINKIDLEFLLRNKDIYYINHLMRQYLTKSSAKLIYDCMVKN